MPDILRVALPPTGQENINRLRPNVNQPPPQNIPDIPDPTRVTGANSQNIDPNKQNEAYLRSFSSNFDNFLQLIRGINNLSSSYTELMYSKLYNIINSGISEEFAAEISQFLQFLNMNETDLLQFLKSQAFNNLKFNDEIFNSLRQLIKSDPQFDQKGLIGEFLKIYDSYTSSEHLLNSMLDNLKNIKASIPKQYSEMLDELMQKLVTNEKFGANAQNLNVLKNEIFPFLSKYISNTRDFGLARDIISVLTLNLAKYELGSSSNFEASLKKLFNNPEIFSKLENLTIEQLKNYLNNKEISENNKLIDSFISVLKSGLEGKAGPESKEVFRDILNALLINRSVYMPLQHIMIPANINGNMFFSEIWVDPNDTSDNELDNPATKMLIKFDIKDVGFFELILLCKKTKIDLQLYIPEKYLDKSINIRQSITNILENNGLSINYLGVEKTSEPIAINEVFPKIYTKKDTINVTI